ncbi:hypothetical protein Tco_0633187 [Tanacetum coccineum]
MPTNVARRSILQDTLSKTSVPSYQSPFQTKLLHSSEHKPEPRRTKYFEAKYNKVKAKLALLNSSANHAPVILTKTKAYLLKRMIGMKNSVHLLIIEKIKNNLLSKHRNLVQELNTCKEQLLVLKQAKLDLLTMHHVNTEILKENQNLRLELKELTSITETWLNSSNKVN